MTANSRANGCCPERCFHPSPLGDAVLPREESTVTAGIVGIPDCAPGPPSRAVRQLASSPCAPCGVARLGACGFGYCIGGFRAPALPPGSCSYRHALRSFGTALPELGGLALYPETRIALHPTGRLYLYRFSPEIPFLPSPPGLQASKQLHSGASHSSPATLPGVAASLSME